MDHFESRTPEEIAAGVFAAPELKWHDKGCVKRYGAAADDAGQCLCEKRRAQQKGERR